jgi:hypothetical protein
MEAAPSTSFFLKTFDQMGLSRSLLCTSQAPFHGIVPGIATTPISQIYLPVTFRTWENIQTKNIQFEVADFETAYNAFIGRPTLTKFMAIPYYTYLVLKMSGPRGVISIIGGIKRAYDCDKETREMADKQTASAELWELKESLVESPPVDLVMPNSKTSKMSIQPEDAISKLIPLSMEEPSKVAHIGNTLDPK